MTEEDVHAQLGEIISGQKEGRTGKELIICDLTGTGAQAGNYAVHEYIFPLSG